MTISSRASGAAFRRCLAGAAYGVLGVIGMVLAGPAQAQSVDRTITMGTMSWEDMTPITYITKKVLEDRGFRVNVTEFSELGIAYMALSRGDIQIMVAEPDFGSYDYWTRYKSRLEKLSPISWGLYQDFGVINADDVQSVDQLNENASRFGNRIIGVEPGSGLMRNAADAVKAYGLTLPLIDGSTAAMTAALKSAADRHEAVVVTAWTPSWVTQKYHVRLLADPKHVFAPPQVYCWIAYRGFAKKNPDAREVIGSIYIPLDAISEINTTMQDGKSVEDSVAAWMTSHSDIVHKWENAAP